MSTDDLSTHLADSGITMRSDSEQYSPGDEVSSPSSSNSPVILYKPPTAWSLIRSAAINLVLPFINGMMLGFGELFAHEAAFRLGWGGTKNLSSRKLGHGRQFGTSLRKVNGGLTTVSSPFRTRYAAAAPIVLGGVSSSRSLSLWGWGGSGNKDASAAEAAAATPEAASAAAPAPAEQTSAVVSAAPTDAAGAASATEPAAVAASDVDLSSISALINGQDILNMREEIGYLHAIGLDYGWGFTSIMQWTLEHVHVWSGLGWGASIMATAVLLRAIMFYPQIQSLKFNAVMQRMRKDPRSNEAMKLVQQGFQESDMEMRQRGQVLNKLLRTEYGVSNWGIMWSLAQIPFTFGLFRIVSGMTHIPVPSLENAGFLWFTDLAATDPYFILPATGTALMMGALLINAKHTPKQQRKMLKPMMYIFGTVGFIGTTFLSAAVNLMTVALGGSTLLTALILNIPSIRRSLGLPTGPADEAVAPPKTIQYEAPRTEAPGMAGLRERLTNSLDDMKKGVSESVSNYTGTYSGTEQEKAERKRRELIRQLETTRKQQEREQFELKYKGKK
ncbi:preprotein translocase subunit YidC [Trichoderma harzianum]|uniref:Preprotein translocase subunit YidC n=1 Tax=Trichoderma harzianum TaxID=5544 RepID=A0A0F9XKL3_TRIHA|nr:preprotein translocase subunit YidC [Trichoderma harzianum]